MNNSYKQTKIYQQLGDREDEMAKSVVKFLDSEGIMPRIETVLSKSHTSSTDFTLHDQDHSFRVAEMIFRLIPDDTHQILSSYEYALLLLSAYLHDMGMSPENGWVRQYRDYLLFSEKGELTDAQIEEFEGFIFNCFGETSFPLAKGEITKEQYSLADEIITYFCRHKHNDWSEKWMKENFKGFSLFSKWMEHLIDICKSHHEGIARLEEQEFEPVKINGQVVHLRYIAMCLRVADVMEIDPERTPDVILKHRDIADKSRIYWYKDHEINISIEGDLVVVKARPANALLHKAIDETALQIQNELQLCHYLMIEKPLSLCTGSDELKHRWRIRPTLFKEIIPFKNSYTYIDSFFRINSKRIIELLAGTQLYRDPLVAIREMLQNSFDAVKECIAYDRLELGEDCNDVDEVSAIRSRYTVKLTLEKDAEGNCWLSCKDNGIGMTKEVIANSFLMGGSLMQQRVHLLEKKCNQRGFSIERTGHFGIGAMSYFMIAEDLHIHTKRKDLGIDNEANGWHLYIPGLFEFGELKQENRKPGTEVRLKLKKDIIEENTEENIIQEISSFLVNIPCELKFESKISSTKRKWNAGWINDTGFYTTLLIDSIKEKRENISMNEDDDISLDDIGTILNDHLSKLKWLTKDGTLPDQWGTYKIFVPYYTLEPGNSLAYAIFNRKGDELIIKNGKYFIPKFENSLAWKGICVKNYSMIGEFETKPFFFLLNLISPEVGKIDVSRETLDIDEDICEEIRTYLEKQFFSLLNDRKLTTRFDNPLLFYLNTPAFALGTEISYFPVNKDGIFTFVNVKECEIIFPFRANHLPVFADTSYQVFQRLEKYTFDYEIESKSIEDDIFFFGKSRLIVNQDLDDWYEPLAFISKELKYAQNINWEEKIYKLSFPPELNEVCRINYNGRYLYNTNNPIVGNLDFTYEVKILRRSLEILKGFSSDKSLKDKQYLGDDFDSIREIIAHCASEIEQFFDLHPEMNVLFNYCDLTDHIIESGKSFGLAANVRATDYDKILQYVLNRFSRMDIHGKLLEYLSKLPETENKLKFITLSGGAFDENRKYILKTVSAEGIVEITEDNKGVVYDLLDSVNDGWRFRLDG